MKRKELREAIGARRATRSLDPVEVSDELIRRVMSDVGLSASCFNNQPWRFVFVREREQLAKVKAALNRGNAWAQAASMIVAVLSRRDLDCVSPAAAPATAAAPANPREYYLFDSGMATAFLLLRLTEEGLVAHPIAGYDEQAAKTAIGAGADMRVITLVIVGVRAKAISPLISPKSLPAETERPPRRSFEEVAFFDRYPA